MYVRTNVYACCVCVHVCVCVCAGVASPAHLVEVEDEVELTDVAEVAVKDLDKVVDDLERDELVVGGVDADEEV